MAWTRFPWSTRRRLGVAGLLVVAFVVLSVLVGTDVTESLDRAALSALRAGSDDPVGPDLLPEIVRDITALGSTTIGIVALVLSTLWLAIRDRPRSAVLQAVLTSSGVGLVYVLKDLFDRGRPDLFPEALLRVGASYPSGHTMTATVAYLTISLFLLRGESEWRLRAYLMTSAALVAVCVGLSRIYLGAHYPTDVIAAWLLGGAWALMASCIADWLVPMGLCEESDG